MIKKEKCDYCKREITVLADGTAFCIKCGHLENRAW
jgi:hypothetical protein